MKHITRTIQISLSTMSLLLVPMSRGQAMETVRSELKASECGADADVLVAVAKEFSAKDGSQIAFSVATPEIVTDSNNSGDGKKGGDPAPEASVFWHNGWGGTAPRAQTVHAWSVANHRSIVTSCVTRLKANGYRVVSGQESPPVDATHSSTSLIEFSSPSYDTGGDQAMVYVNDNCKKKGSFPQLTCGLSEFIVLTKRDRTWTVTGQRPTVIP